MRLFSDWSRKVPWHKAAVRPIPYLKRFEGELTDLLDIAESGFGNVAEAGRLKLTLLLGIGNEILALGSGQSTWLLNVFFGRGKAVRLPEQFRGCLEPGAGLLLASEGFLKNVEGKGLEEALQLPEIRTEQQAERRLRELAAPRGAAALREASASRKPASSLASACEEREPMAAVLLVGR